MAVSSDDSGGGNGDQPLVLRKRKMDSVSSATLAAIVAGEGVVVEFSIGPIPWILGFSLHFLVALVYVVLLHILLG